MVGPRSLTRQQIAGFAPDPRTVRAFEEQQEDIQTRLTQVAGASFLTLGDEPSLGSERVLALNAGDFSTTDGGANGLYSVALSPTGVTAGVYGDDAYYPTFTVDAKGRLTSIAMFPLPAGGGGGGGTTFALDGGGAASSGTPSYSIDGGIA